MTDTLADEILRWDKEARAILTSIKRIVEYFGTDEEYEWLLAALREPEAYRDGVLPAFRDPAWRADIPGVSIPRFTFERSTAEKINPLLILLAEPEPYFVSWARHDLEKAHLTPVLRHYGGFVGNFAINICDPVWGSFPDLVPEGYPLGPSRPPISGHASKNVLTRNDAIGTTDTLADKIVRWDNETRAILLSIKRIVEYFGTDEEYESLLAALRDPEAYFEGVLPSFRDPAWRAETPGCTDHKFKCERSIAEKITPLLQILVEPVPEFIPWARKELETEHFEALMRHAGKFLGDIATDICKPIWQGFPDLAPEGWQPGLKDGSEDTRQG